MIRFSARYFDGISSSAKAVEVVVLDATNLEIRERGGTRSYSVQECEFEAPLGNTKRVIILPDNGRLETNDLAQYDALQDPLSPGMDLKWAHWLERRWRWVVASMAGLVVFTGAFFIWGIPVAALVVAHRIPVEWNDHLGNGVLETLDKYFMEPTELTAEAQAGYHTWFEDIAAKFESEHTYTLHFRSTDLGANAFALPNGYVVVTDSLIELVSGQDEFEAIIAHEIGHVIHRHTMQMVLRDTGVFVFISTLLGDLTSMSSLASAVPTLLIENSYSRGFEREADLVSGDWLQRKYGTTQALKSILIKMHEGDEGMDIPELMSTHSDLRNRILLLEETFSVLKESESP